MAVWRVLVSRWLLTLLGTGLLAALVWLFGPLVDALEPALPRALVIAVMVLAWFAVNLLLDLRRRQRDGALTRGVAAGASAEEAAALGAKLTAALTLMKKARRSRGYLYEQPWYAIIGPPGVGKTTALLNAGLKFPLAEAMGSGASPGSVAGVGGTRLCDWWFTDRAVLIDTAGRYTTQDSDAEVDRAGWTAFLDLLKRTRPRQPLNGVIVAIALSDIVTFTDAQRLAHAAIVRRRVSELEQHLGVRLPIYALFTKADLIAGFTEYFDDLDRERRDQVWGATFPLGAPPLAGFAGAFKALLAPLHGRLFARIDAERGPDRRALIACFPTQVASLEQPLAAFLREVFAAADGRPAPMLRGFYMASGTQEGSPVDRLTATMARSFGVDQRRMPSLRPEQGRSYFLGELLRQVIFGEAMLVSRRPGALRRRRVVRGLGYAAAVLLLLGGAGVLWRARAGQQAEIDAVAAAAASYAAKAQAAPLDPVADSDLAAVLPLLNEARALPFGHDHGGQDHASEAGRPWWDLSHVDLSAIGLSSVGLAQAATFSVASETTYRHALERIMLPRLLLGVERQMRDGLSRPDFLYEATRVYLMLGGQGPLDRSLVRAWLGLEWKRAFPGEEGAPSREALAHHLDTLMERPLPQLAMDGGLIEAARATFGRVSFAQRVYSRLKPSRAAQAVPGWSPLDVLDAAGATVFVRASGRPIADAIPGLFTIDGFHKVLLPSIPGVARDVAAESWVLGTSAAINPQSPQARSLQHDVVMLYERDYIAQWEALLADLELVPLRSIPQAAQDLYIVAGPQSELRQLLGGIAREVTLSTPPADAARAPAAEESDEDRRAREVLERLGGPTTPAAPVIPPGREVDEHFKPLRDFVGTGHGAPLDFVLKPVSDLQQQMAKLAAAAPGSPMQSGDDPAVALRTEALRQPQPVQRWLMAMAASGAALRGNGAKQQMASSYNAAGGAAVVCKSVVARYPFTAGAADAVSLDEFARLFAPGGMLDGFFDQQLRGFVDTSGATWKPQALDTVPAPVGAADVAQFRRAAAIRDAYFAGGRAPNVRFDIRPISTDAASKGATLEFDGTKITGAGGIPPATIVWPGASPMQNVRLSFDTPAGQPAAPVAAETGPWGIFKLFARGTWKRDPASAGHYSLSLRLAEREAAYDITLAAPRGLNPLDPSLLQEFRCPVVQ